MANYCSCNLTIKSDDVSLIDKFIDIANPPKPNAVSQFLGRLKGASVGRDYGLLGFLSPMPEALKKTITNGYSGDAPEWHNWMVENWGCAYDVAVESTERKSENEIQFKFHSRYSPPLQAIEHGAKTIGFQYRLVYCETGNQFAGIATENDHQEYEFTFDVHPNEAGVPKEIVEEFGLEAVYEEVKADEGR